VRERLLTVKLEEAFLLEASFELLKGELERPHALGFDVIENKLVLTARFINADPAAAQHLYPVLKRELEKSKGGTEHDRPDLGLFVLEGKICMSGLGNAEVRELAFDPYLVERPFEEVFYLSGKLSDGQDVRFHGTSTK